MPINISTSAAIFRWRPSCWLRVTGADAASFLQGQFTNDLRGLRAGAAVYGLWLSVKGKVLADSFVLRGGEENEFWIGSYFSSAVVVRERLESHVIADDVSVEDQTEQWAGVTLFGEAGAQAREASAAGTGYFFSGRRERAPVIEWVYPLAAGEPNWLATRGSELASLSAEEMERRRIDARIPAIPVDIGPADLPNEAGLEQDAISYIKGCYLGQEVMARLKSMGQVRRRLLCVAGRGRELPARPAAVFATTRQVGELRSAVADGAGGWLGLAMLSLLHLSPAVELAFSAGGEAALRLVDAP